MEQNSTTTTTSEPQTAVRELTRPKEGRMLAGVAQGLANRFDFSPLLIRALFVILTLAGGGLGIILYLTGWFLIRSEEEPRSPAERLFSGEAVSS
jgi:phage shock protein PspC (stress-responsive transcriptional regulator)